MRVRLHPPAPGLIEPAKGQFDHTLVGVRAAFDHGPVRFADLAVLEQKAQMSEGFAMAPEHKASGGVLIETVGQSRRTRQAKPQCVKIVLEA